MASRFLDRMVSETGDQGWRITLYWTRYEAGGARRVQETIQGPCAGSPAHRAALRDYSSLIEEHRRQPRPSAAAAEPDGGAAPTGGPRALHDAG